MAFYPQERLALFIDGPNLYNAARALNFDIDYRRLLQLFQLPVDGGDTHRIAGATQILRQLAHGDQLRLPGGQTGQHGLPLFGCIGQDFHLK